MMRGHGQPSHKEYTVKSFVALALIAMLAGCATPGKSEKQIFDEAATAHVMSLPSGENRVRLHSVKIPSHGLIADNLALAMAGGANAMYLKEELLKAKSVGDTGFLIIGASTVVDVAVIGNACEGLDLQGMQIYYSGTDAQKDKVRTAVEKTQAQFYYINAQ